MTNQKTTGFLASDLLEAFSSNIILLKTINMFEFRKMHYEILINFKIHLNDQIYNLFYDFTFRYSQLARSFTNAIHRAAVRHTKNDASQ